MIGLSALNDYNRNTGLDVNDLRSIGAYFDRYEPTPQEYEIASTTVACVPGIEITSIVGGSLAQVKYIVEIVTGGVEPFLSGSTLTFPTMPSGVTLTHIGDVYTITGITDTVLWNAIKSFTWTLPSDYDTYAVWYLRSTISYYDETTMSTKNVTWSTYDPNHYLQQAMFSTADMVCSPIYPRVFASDMYITSELKTLRTAELQAVLSLSAALNVRRAGTSAITARFTVYNILSRMKLMACAMNTTTGGSGYNITILPASVINSTCTTTLSCKANPYTRASSALTTVLTTACKANPYSRASASLSADFGGTAYDTIIINVINAYLNTTITMNASATVHYAVKANATITSTSTVSCSIKRYRTPVTVPLTSNFTFNAIIRAVQFNCAMTSTAVVSATATNVTINISATQTYTGNAKNTIFASQSAPTVTGGSTAATAYIMKITSIRGKFTTDLTEFTNLLVNKTVTISGTTVANLNAKVLKVHYYPDMNNTLSDIITYQYQETNGGITKTIKTVTSTFNWNGVTNTLAPSTVVVTGSEYLVPTLYVAYYKANIHAIGGGAGGSKHQSATYPGHGGGSGTYTTQSNVACNTFTPTGGTRASITVSNGAGGSGGSITTGIGGDGSITQVVWQAYPGVDMYASGGVASTNYTAGTAGGRNYNYSGGTGSLGGSLYGNGGGGAIAVGGNSSTTAPGAGGSGVTINSVVYGIGGIGGSNSVTTQATTYGSGGNGGSGTVSSTVYPGISGQPGVVILEFYI